MVWSIWIIAICLFTMASSAHSGRINALKLDKSHPSFVGFRNQVGIIKSPPAPTCGTTREATDAITFNAAVSASAQGDCIEFPAGNYDIGVVTIPAINPGITIIPDGGTVTFTGTTRFVVMASNITFYDLSFSMDNDDGIDFDQDMSGGRVLYCDFTGYGDDPLDVAIRVDGDDIEIAYSLFTEMVGFVFTIAGAGDFSFVAQDTHIHHNEFTSYGGVLGEGGSVGHVGQGGITLWGPGFSNRMIFEYNYIDSWDGDPELISMKSSDNIVRYNYIVNTNASQHLDVRVGRNNLFYGNYIENTATSGNTYGWRVSGSDNWFIYNMLVIPDGIFGISTLYHNGSGTSPTAELVATENTIQHNVFEKFDRYTTVTDNGLSPQTAVASGNRALQNFHLGRSDVDSSSSFSSSGTAVTWSTWSSTNELNNIALPWDEGELSYISENITYATKIEALGMTINMPPWFVAIGFVINIGFTTK